MANANVNPSVPKKGRKWLRLLGWCLGGLLVLLVVVYFVATSAAFLKGFILPRVAKAVNADITLSDASVSPFSQIVLKDLKVKTSGTEPLVAVPEMRLRYSLMDIIGGKINVEEVSVVSPTIVMVVNADGTSNLDPFTKAGTKPTTPATPAAPAKPGKPLQLDIRKFALTGATVRYLMVHTNGSRDTYEVSNVNVTLTDLKNGQVAKLALAAAIRAQMNPPGAPAAAANVLASLNGNFDIGLTSDAKLATAKGNIHFGVDKADGALAQAASFGTDLDCDLTPTELKGLGLRFQKGATALGQIKASGPFDLAKLEGRIVVEVPALDRGVLNLATAGTGMDFGTTVIQSTNTIVLAQAGSQITAGGQFRIKTLQVILTNQTTPTLDFVANYDVSVDRAKTNTVLRAFNMQALQQGRPILHAETTAPLTLTAGAGAGSLPDALLTFGITNLDLANWQPVLGKILPAGLINAEVKMLTKQGGNQVTLEFASSADHLTLAPSGKAAEKGGAPETPASLSARMTASFAIDRNTGSKFPTVKGNAHVGIDRAAGPWSDLATFSTDLNCDVTPRQLNGVGVRFAKGATSLGEIRASGPLDLAKNEGRIVVEIPGIDKQLLNLAAAGKGLDFGPTLIKSTNTIELTDAGRVIKAGGQILVNQFQVGLTNQTTPPLDFRAGYDVTVDLSKSNLVLRAVDLTCVQQGSPILHADLSSPMTVTWGTAAAGVGDSTLSFAVTSLDLAKWKPMLGTVTPTGMINAQVKLLSQQAGKQLTLDLNSTLDNLTIIAGTNAVSEAGISFQMNGKATDFNQFTLGQYRLQVTQRSQPLLTTSGSAAFDKTTQDASLKLTTQVMVARVLKALSMPVPPALSNAPAQIDLTADVAMHKQIVDLHQVQLSLAPTARATNQIQLTGQVDNSVTNALQGNLKLTAEALDFTAYYDLFMSGAKTATNPPATASIKSKGAKPAAAPEVAVASSAPAATEPPAMTLPIRSFTFDSNIRRLYLHEVEITNFLAGVKMDSNHVAVAPFKLALNGAPVDAGVNADLSVPGYKYAVNLNATAIPLPPLISSFQPARQGQISGTLTAQGQITGAGITGPSLQTNLAGQFYCGTTNLNLSVENVQNKMLKLLVTVVIQIPDLIKDPTSAASGLLSKLTGSTNTTTPSDLQHSIVNAIELRGTAGAGKVTLQQVTVSGPTFLAEAPTTITLAPVLTNSALNVPVSISLSRSVAQTIHFMPANTPTNATYVKLPDFFTMKGTVGAPQKDIQTMALLSGVAQGIAPGVGGKAGSILQGVTGLLGGKGSTNTPAGTNSSTSGLMQNLGGLFSKPAATTNNPAAPTNASPVNSLLNGLFGPKK